MSKSEAESFWIEHLLRRAGFGFSPPELKYYKSLGYERTLEELLEPEKVDNSKLADALEQQGFDFTRLVDLKRWWIYRMAFTRRPLEEKMTLFWHGHFATSNQKVDNPYFMYIQNEKMRNCGLGNFGDLLLAMSKDPAMIIWLDNQQNRKGKPNENYAREVMELFSLGIGNYTEKDIKEGARAFTGWQSRPDGFFFNAREHDNGDKVFLGQRGNFNGDEVVNILAQNPATPKFLAKKLCKFFVADNPSDEIVDDVAGSYKLGGRNICKMMETIFTHPEFISQTSYHAKIKGPAELAVGTIKSFQVTKLDADLPNQMARMGQSIFEPMTVKGWDGGAAWVSTDMMMERFNFATRVTQQKFDAIEGYIVPSALVAKQGLQTPSETVNYFLNLLVDNDVPESTRNELTQYVLSDNAGKPIDANLKDERLQDAKLRGLVHLIMTLPTYQLA
jgi:uncharacterized protein (DUF1800 family)